MAEPLVRSERRGAVALLTLNRPDKLNAVNAEVIRALDRALDAAEADDTVRTIVLAGAGRAAVGPRFSRAAAFQLLALAEYDERTGAGRLRLGGREYALRRPG